MNVSIWSGRQAGDTAHLACLKPLRHDSNEQISGWKQEKVRFQQGALMQVHGEMCKGYAEQLLYFAKMTVFNDAIIYCTVCFSVTEEPSPFR